MGLAATTRAQVLAYRTAAQQLDGVGPPGDAVAQALDVLDLGVQDTPYGSAALALAARGAGPPGTDGPRADDAMALVWSVRGAPHLHRRRDLLALAGHLWPVDDADATRRITAGPIRVGARLGLAAFTATARALQDVVTAPLPKGEVSRQVSARVPASLTYDCRSCAARHISGGLLQQAGLAGGVEVDPDAGSTRLAPLPERPAVPPESGDVSALVRTYLRFLGPAGPAEVAEYLGTSTAVLRRVWPGDLVPVRVDGTDAWHPAEHVDALLAVQVGRNGTSAVRLLPPGDPWLQARDRALVVPDAGRRSQLWRGLANPGAVLAGGEVVGWWRVRAGARSRSDVTVVPFEPLPPEVSAALPAQAERVAAARGASDVRLVVQE